MKKIILVFALLFVAGAMMAQVSKIRYFQIQDASAAGKLLKSDGSNNWVEVDATGSEIALVDAGAYFTTDNVEAALQQLGPLIANNHVAVTLGGGNSTALTLSGQELTLSDAQLEINLAVDDLKTLTGVAGGSVNLGTFTGTTISDNVTIKTALQELETAVESFTNQQVETFSFTGGVITLGLTNDGVADSNLDIGAVVSGQFVREEFEIGAGTSTVTASNTLPTDQDGVIVVRNGLVQDLGVGDDYTVAGQVFTFTESLAIGERVVLIFPVE